MESKIEMDIEQSYFLVENPAEVFIHQCTVDNFGAFAYVVIDERISFIFLEDTMENITNAIIKCERR